MTLLLDPNGVAEGEADPLIGTVVFGDYRITKRIGMGGFGAVYVAEDPDIGKVAIKVLHPAAAAMGEIVARFIAEVRAAHKIGNPHIVKFVAKGVLDDGRSYLAMEYLQGLTLSDYLTSWTVLAVEDAVELLVQIGWALGAAHNEGIVHRDVKPENLFLCESPRPRFVKVLDFGIAKFRDANMISGYETRTGVVMGTPAYMAPEQKMGAPVDKRADIYSLGLIMYQMVTGSLPETIPGQNTWRDPRDHRPELSESLAAAILWAIQFHPDDRPPSMHAWLKAIIAAIPTGHEIALRFDPDFDRRADADEKTRPVSSDAAMQRSMSAPPAAAAPSTLRGAAGEVQTSYERPHPSAGRRGPSLVVWLASGGAVIAAIGVVIAVRAFRDDGTAGAMASGATVDARAAIAMEPNRIVDAGTIAVRPSDATPAPDAAPQAVAVVPDAGASLPPPTPTPTKPPTAPHDVHAHFGVGHLRVVVNPWANVWLDGRSLGETPQDVQASAGPHHVRIANDARSESLSITLTAGQTKTIERNW